MMAPLNREQQIELMTSADVRMDERVRAWIKHPQIRKAVRIRQSEMNCSGSYDVTQKVVRRCA
jgi:hypothetical protein